MIRPQLSADGRYVRLPLTFRMVPLVDELALAYTEGPDPVGRLLAAHATAVDRLDFAAASPTLPDHIRAMRAAEADATREALLAETRSADRLDDLLTPDQAITLATQITRLAARIRQAPDRRPRP
ncbi:hypothetical protein [Streptomyces sp. BPTC-684]|uniref:hypothetical protein n=1 Tax=Streptomyces sp. BPTC-684 TaxID=3043734 RepID=UPI0024B27AA3|nr:hypothetical protein [Streptomyces sp. BPTC-684]WHM36290.1 hypothetical protein QIY60_04670 [Streptomyces sp. BPTC-684]